MPSALRLRRSLAIVLAFAAGGTAIQAGCSSNSDDSLFPSGGDVDADAPGGPDAQDPGTFPESDGSPDSSYDANFDDALAALVITPSDATVDVTVENGAVKVNAPVNFKASYGGSDVAATWLLDRGELGDIDTSGVFKASGKHVGEGTITARFGAREGTAKIKVNVAYVQNGTPATPPPAGLGGLGGVGGEPLGAAVDEATVTKLKGPATAPVTAAELSFLYPYDKTVWPRGLLPPLLMWNTTHNNASAVYVKISEQGFSFEGTYALTGAAGSAQRRRARIQEDVWEAATLGNRGDDLKVEIRILDGNTVYGPITETWKVAAGVLKGTVYYNSYDSKLTGGTAATTGGVIAIKPRAPAPSLAVAGQAGKCHVCHTLSADGSTLWANDGTGAGAVGSATEYANTASYDLRNNGARTEYKAYGITPTKPENDHKFTWSAPYPDGSFALASSRYAREAYIQGDSQLFKRSDGSVQTSTGLGGVVASAVTPAFSPDGRKVAFNFWTGPGAGGVTAGNGRSLAVMDFSCGAAAGSTACAAGAPYAFTGIREIYRNANTYPSWPSFLPDGKAVVFNNQTTPGTCGPANGTNPANTINNCFITTWYSAKSELWIAQDNASAARKLDAANGSGIANFPTNADHPDDTKLNYQPTVNPVPSGGYYWVVFTSRRIYGNILNGKPWGNNSDDGGGPQKKLWVAAIDVNNPAGGADPSHPAFYLPGQEIEAGNARAFWVVDPCKANGNTCESGDECCNGFCRKDGTSGALVCMDEPPGNKCSNEFEKCTIDADCCIPQQKCINNKCGAPVSQPR